MMVVVDRLKNVAAIALLIVIVSLLPHCTTDMAGGGGSEAGNARIIGKITNMQGEPAGNVIVRIMLSDFNPVRDVPVDDSCIDTTNVDGTFRFNVNEGSRYSIQARDLASGLRALLTSIVVTGTVDTSVECSLQQPGAVRVMLCDDLETGNGYLYIPGTTVHVFLKSQDTFALLDSVPAGSIPSVSYSTLEDTGSRVISENVTVLPGDTVTIVYEDWTHSKEIILNTSISGADVNETVYGFPVLIRLDSSTFDFSQAKESGEDIRFTSYGGIPLQFEIEQWDAIKRQAALWVRIDTLRGNDTAQSIIMYWGNSGATGSSHGMAVFDTAAGFQGVWHLNEAADDSAYDATANHFDGAAYHMSGNTSSEGTIGNARTFDGDSSCIIMSHTSGSRLNFPENGTFTVSAWVKADSINNGYHAIVSKGFKQYFLWSTTFSPDVLNKPVWEFSTFTTKDNWYMSHTPAVEGEWVLLTGVRKDTEQYLYCNGDLVSSEPVEYMQDTTRDTTNDLSLGRFISEVTYPANFGNCPFRGKIDEVRINSVARTDGWIRLSYMNQRRDDRLVRFK